MNTFNLHILEADSVFYEGPCESLIIPTDTGLYGIMANHSNMISAVVPGELTYRLNDDTRVAAVSAGLVKVENNDVLVLVDSAEHPEEIDVKRAERTLAKAKEEMLQKRNIREYTTAQAELTRAINRLKVKKHYN